MHSNNLHFGIPRNVLIPSDQGFNICKKIIVSIFTNWWYGNIWAKYFLKSLDRTSVTLDVFII